MCRQFAGKALLGASDGQHVDPSFLEFNIDSIVASSVESTSSSGSEIIAASVDFDVKIVLRLVLSLLPLAFKCCKLFLRFITKCHKVRICWNFSATERNNFKFFVHHSNFSASKLLPTQKFCHYTCY
jgi:hypothetical protein